MIRKIKIKNFQCHEDLELDLVEGINIITGASDRGKSAILRAVDLVRENRPSGFAYRYDPRILKRSKKTIKETETTSVAITLDDGNEVARERNKREINQYRINNTVLQAMRSGVPEEISSLLNIASYSVQSQHNPYFLLNESDGEVSRQINELVGLEAINKSLKKASSIVDEAKAKAKEASEEILLIESQLEKLKDIDSIEKRFDILLEKAKEEEELSGNVESLIDLIEEVSDFKAELDMQSLFLEVQDRVASFDKMVDQLSEIHDDINQFEADIDYLDDCFKDLERYENVVLFEKQITELSKIIEEYSSLSINTDSLESDISSFEENKQEWRRLVNEIKEVRIKYTEELKQIKQCPTCGSDVSGKDIQWII